MLDKHKLLGSTKIDLDNKVTIVKNAAKILGVNKGDILSFYDEEGKVYIKKG
jgi:hypothetical protein